MKLLMNAVLKLVSGLLLTALLLFAPAGTWHYPGGWLFCGLLFVPMLILGLALYWKAPELLKKRLNTKETEKDQQGVIVFSVVLFVASFLAAGLDFRFGWTHVPKWLVWAAAAVQLGSYGLYAEVLRENAYLSRTVEVQEGQTVIDTGLYGIVRHPMYTATILMCLAIPLVLGSWISFALMLLYPVIILFRIRGEEALLEEGLPGYREYKTKVRWRLIPYLW
ncbi:MAG: isoprenylcysteine carboxylmethyltransferase family protein [Eubacteriales bacterium]|nr:isoprenylcysteine carboxylmethyltransferase family protein [Eubacteriales bacterium]